MFSNLSFNSISFAIVTPSLDTRGLEGLSRITVLPLGPRVTLTMFATLSMPFCRVRRASSLKIICFVMLNELLHKFLREFHKLKVENYFYIHHILQEDVHRLPLVPLMLHNREISAKYTFLHLFYQQRYVFLPIRLYIDKF